MIQFSKRCTLEEQMDDPSLGNQEMAAVFSDLNRTNTLLGGQRITLRAARSLMERFPRQHYTIADLGCGDGDMLRKLAIQCRSAGISSTFIGVDLSEAALALAAQKSLAFPEIHYRKANLLDLKKGSDRFDILLCTLALHHFPDEELPALLGNFTGLASIGVIINDLQRNRLAYYLFMGFSRIFIKTEIAKQDGLISIRRGFRRNELLALSKMLPQKEHKIKWRWIFRYLWVIQSKPVPLHE
jgi:2-polyprenyl-3-methyl-5-hydroxy-6-metoxy-1,4-benzoquinol methylase